MAAACDGRLHLVEDGEMRLNLFMTALLPTGEGKEHALRVAEAVAAAAGAFVAGKPASGSALEEILVDHGSLLLAIDEAGHLLAAMNALHAPHYLVDLSSQMLQLFGRGSGVHRTRAKGGEPGRDVCHPVVNAMMFSTPEKFAEAVGEINVHEGQLGRHLFFIDTEPVAHKRIYKAFVLPARAARVAGQIRAGGVFQCVDQRKPPENAGIAMTEPGAIMYADGVGDALQALMDRFSARQSQPSSSPLERALAARAYENTLRVAGTLAVWDDPAVPVLRIDHLLWAEGLVLRSVHDVVAFTGEQMHAAGVLANAVKVLRICERIAAGELKADRIQEIELIRVAKQHVPRRTALRHSKMSKIDFDKAVEHLIAVGDVHAYAAALPAGGGEVPALHITRTTQ